MALKVGMPRTLFYYTYYPLWKAFVEALGAEAVSSGPTNKETLDAGIRETVNDACIPIKLYHGHVLDLKDRVDYLFVPRLVSPGGSYTYCPKFLGLPDMIRYAGMELPPLVDTRLNLRGLPGGLNRFLRATAAALGFRNPFTQARALRHALKQYALYQELLLGGLHPQRAFEALERGTSLEELKGEALAAPPDRPAEEGLRVALLGYPYIVFDPFVSADVYHKLKHMGAAVLTTEQVPASAMRRMSRVLPQNCFWHYSNRVCWAALYYIERKAVDGIIHLTAYACGPDAMVDKILELEAKKAKLPYLTLTIDEHTGTGGVQTRIEAFVDMLQARQEKRLKEAAS